MIRGVLFDLDGTFADTAPDLGAAVNHMRAVRGMPAVPLSETRKVTSLGARGLLGAGFGMGPEHPDYPALREEFLDIYRRNLCVLSSPFPGMIEVVNRLEVAGLRWGIVTNKSEALARPLLAQLGFAQRTGCIIGGDTTPHMKPHPAPLLAGANAIGVPAVQCAYVGDDERDILAGRAAGMITIAAGFGYLNGSDPERWGADYLVNCALDIPAIVL